MIDEHANIVALTQGSATTQSKLLHVGNLSRFTSERELRAFFAEHGLVRSVRLVLDWQTGESRRFGLIQYETEEAAEYGLLALNGSMLHGHLLSVSVEPDRALRATELEPG